ncbi:MAG: DUF421 domain-containing protein [Bacillus sp. (in: firmicutes)]
MEGLGMLILRTILMYFVVLCVFRIMGKREIVELSIVDLVVFLMLADIAVIALEDKDINLMKIIVPMLVLLCIQVLISYVSLKSKKLREIIEGKPRIIIHDGKIDEQAMKKERYNFDDLLQQLRKKDVFDLAEVAFAILEPSGELTILKKGQYAQQKQELLPLPLILDGVIQNEHLQLMHYQESWLMKELQQRGYEDISVISYCSFNKGVFYIDEKN